MNRLQRGFTLIEILVVVSILGVLMGLVSLLVIRSSTIKRRQLTEQRVTQLKMAVEFYRQEFKKLPPMTVKELSGVARWKGLVITPQNETNECSEALYVALQHPDFTKAISESDFPGDDPFGNTDDDIWNQVPSGASDENAREVLDAYGNPIVYIHKNRYNDPVQIVNADGETVEVQAVKRPNGTFYNPNGFQIISVGENGVQDEDPEFSDDLMNFTRSGGE